MSRPFNSISMKVTIIKPHLHYRPNDEVDIDEGTANYWLRVGIATVEKPDNEAIEKTLDTKLKAAKKKK